MKRPPSLRTLCIHGGRAGTPAEAAHGALHAPLFNDTTFAFADTASLVAVMDGERPGDLYTRFGHNPTIRAVEAQLAAIEGAEGALAFGAGLAAISAAILGHVRAGERVLCVGDVYGGTQELFETTLKGMGIESTFLLETAPEAVDHALEGGARVVYFETPTNPKLDIVDIAAVSRVAHARGALVVVDGTFATPVLQRPLALGADLVVHSATKYLGGHGDITGGVVAGAAVHLAPVWHVRRRLGQVMAPEIAFSLARSLRTLVVRVEAQCRTASVLAERLAADPRVLAVHYPGLPSHPGHKIAEAQMHAFGAIVTFVVGGGASASQRVIEALRLVALAPSLGGVESLATEPRTTTHRGLGPDARAARGIVDGMIRLSVGLEDVEDLWADLDTALSGAAV